MVLVIFWKGQTSHVAFPTVDVKHLSFRAKKERSSASLPYTPMRNKYPLIGEKRIKQGRKRMRKRKRKRKRKKNEKKGKKNEKNEKMKKENENIKEKKREKEGNLVQSIHLDLIFDHVYCLSSSLLLKPPLTKL